MMLVHGQQILGKRDKQEDSFAIIRQNDQDPSSDLLLLLADGMGGHTGGEIASTLAIEAFGRHFVAGARANRPLERLQESLLTANEALRSALSRDASLRGMGCTMIGAIKSADSLHWVSVGDSVMYLMRRGEISRINADHSVLGELMERVERGALTRAEALAHPRRNALRSAVMGGQIALVDARSLLLEPDDVIVIASDGLDTLSPTEIADVLAQSPRAPRDATAALLQTVERRKSPSQDNTTVIVYWHSDGTPSAFLHDSKWRFGNRGMGSGLLKAALVAGFVALAAGLAFLLMPAPPVPETPKSETTVQSPSTKIKDTTVQDPAEPAAETAPEAEPEAPADVPADKDAASGEQPDGQETVPITPAPVAPDKTAP